MCMKLLCMNSRLVSVYCQASSGAAAATASQVRARSRESKRGVMVLCEAAGGASWIEVRGAAASELQRQIGKP